MGRPCYRSPMASTPAATPTDTRAASPTVGATPATGDVDGRRLRRDRNRDAVVQALLALYREGNLDPSADEIATRSGVSARSVFRYFDDVEDLANAAITHQLMDVAHLLPLTCPPDRPLAERIAAVAQQRAALYEAIFPVALVSRLRAPVRSSSGSSPSRYSMAWKSTCWLVTSTTLAWGWRSSRIR